MSFAHVFPIAAFAAASDISATHKFTEQIMAIDTTYQFDITVQVNDPEALRKAAMAHKDARPDDTFLKADGSTNVGACLVMFLDRDVPGCTILGSSAAEV